MITAEEKLKILQDWAKSVKNLLGTDDQVKIEVTEVDHEVEIHIKVKETQPKEE